MVVFGSGNSTDAVRIKHGYDRAGSRTYREQTVDSNSYFDEVYRYDGSDRLTGMDRGPLAAPKTSVSPLKFSQCWGIDATGNWRDFREDSDGANGWNLVQTRTHNGVNEISDISETSGLSWITPLYDRAGNMTRVPKPSDPTQYYSCTYDAWNRLVKLQDGANTVAEYRYDGAKRRIIKKSYSGGSLTETRHLFYSRGWQVLEERVGSSTSADRQFVWGLRYVDDLILRDRNADSNSNTGNYGKSGSGLEERLYCLQDANWNVTAVANASGTIQERYAYTAYGTPIFLTSAFASRSSSNYDWETLYAGYRYDPLVALYHIRHRTYAPGVNWLLRDPIGYRGGRKLYAYVGGSPLVRTDPAGLEWISKERCDDARLRRTRRIAYLIGDRSVYPPIWEIFQPRERRSGAKCKSDSGCELVTFLAEYPHSCAAGSISGKKVGHGSMGIGDDFFDLGPGNRATTAGPVVPWWGDLECAAWQGSDVTKRGRVLLGDVVSNLSRLASWDGALLDVVKLELCVTKEKANAARDWWRDKMQNPDTFNLLTNNCAEAVQHSMGMSCPDASWQPHFMIDHVAKYRHQCGPDKGYFPKPERIQTEGDPYAGT